MKINKNIIFNKITDMPRRTGTLKKVGLTSLFAVLVLVVAVTVIRLSQTDHLWMEVMSGIPEKAAGIDDKGLEDKPKGQEHKTGWERQWDENLRVLVAVPVENISLRKTPGFGDDVVAEIATGTFLVWRGETITDNQVDFHAVSVKETGEEGYVAARYCVDVEFYADETKLTQVNVDTSLYSYEMMEEDIRALCGKYPDRLSSSVIGISADERDIYAVVLGDPKAENKVMLQAGIHGREYMTTQLAMRLLEYYAAYYDTAGYGQHTYRELFQNTAFYVVPMANPDGVTISQLGTEALADLQLREKVFKSYQTDSKDRHSEAYGLSYEEYQRIWKANARGVDLNNNFNAGFEDMRLKSYPSFENHKGEKAESEPETKALVDFVTAYDFDSYLSYHSKGQIIYFDVKGNETATSASSERLARMLEAKTGYLPVSTKKSDYVNLGGFSDWIQLSLQKPSVTLEMGLYSCPLTILEFPSMWLRNRESWAFMAERMYAEESFK